MALFLFMRSLNHYPIDGRVPSPLARFFRTLGAHFHLVPFVMALGLGTALGVAPPLTWTPPAAITYGTPLGPAQLNATATGVPGTFTYVPSFGTVLDAGNTQNLSVTFTPDDTATFEPATIGVTIDVLPAPLRILPCDEVAEFNDGSAGGMVDNVPFVTVGDPNNSANLQTFEISKYEITNADYTAFLNAMAKDDPSSVSPFDPGAPLYNGKMGTDSRGGILQNGSAPNYTYTVKNNMGNKPVNFVSFWDACRYCNWLHNGMPTGDRSASTTEDGAYDLTDPAAMLANNISRKPGARAFIPTSSEWHEAAHFDPTKGVGGDYWFYATQSNDPPTPALASPTGGGSNSGPNVVNYDRAADWDSNGNGIVESQPVFGSLGPEDGSVVSVGASGNTSYYGAADMAGNVAEWTETAVGPSLRLARGGSWNGTLGFLAPTKRFFFIFQEEYSSVGIRIARPTEFDQSIIPTPKATFFGFVNGDGPSSLTSPLRLSAGASGDSPQGEYDIFAFNASSPNYDITFETGTLYLNTKDNPVIDWPTPAGITYGTPLSIGQLNAVAGFGGNNVPGTFTYEPISGTVLDAGAHTLVARFVPDDSTTYNPIMRKVTFTVAPAPLTITGNNASRDEGASNPALSATINGFVNGENEADLWIPVDITTTANIDSPPGQYPITPQNAFSPNYDITFQPGTLTVTGENVLITPQLTWNPADLIYGGSLDATHHNASAGEVQGTYFYNPPTGFTPTAAGDLVLDVTFTPTNMATYTEANASVTVSVGQAPLIVRVDSLTRVENTENPTLTANYEGFVLGDTMDDLDFVLQLSTTATIGSPPGVYPIIATVGADNDYAVQVFNGSLTVTAEGGLQVPDIVWTPSPLVYGEALGAAQLNADVSGGIAGQYIYNPPFGHVPPRAGELVLDVIFRPDNTAVYDMAEATVSTTVAKAPLTIRINDQTRATNDDDPTFTASYEGFVLDDTMDVLDEPLMLSTTATSDSPPGEYPITGTIGADDSYTFTIVDGTLTITQGEPKDSQLAWETPAGIVYGQALSEAQLNATVDGEIPGTWTYDPPAGSVLDAGTQTLNATFTPANLDDYNPAQIMVSLEVAKANLMIQADDITRPAGGENPTLTASYEGFAEGDGPADLDSPLQLATTATSESAPGAYPITGTIGEDNNYAISFEEGTLTVENKLDPELLWNAPEDLTYGEALTETQLNASVTDRILGTFTYTPPMGTVLGTGTHRLEVSFTPEDLFAFNPVSASVSVTVTPAPLDVRALNAEREENTENPDFEISYEGFVNGETEEDLTSQASATTDATIDSAPGNYAIRVTGAESGNYTFNYIPGVLTVTEAPPTDLPELRIVVNGDAVELRWKDTPNVVLQTSIELETWNTANTENLVIEDGEAILTIPSIQIERDVTLYFRLAREE